jgi:hypothetical protein
MTHEDLPTGHALAPTLGIARAALLIVAMIPDIGFAFQHWGASGAVAALVLFPATLLLLPVYAGLATGYWLPALVTYVPQSTILVLVGIAALRHRRKSN